MTRVLVTGGSGFIGTKTIEYLRATFPDMAIRGLDLDWPEVEGIESIRGSILDIDDVGRAVQDCDYVFHIAAMLGVQRTDSEPLRCLNVNLQGTVNVLNAAVKAGVKKFILTSSSEVYGEQQSGDMISETSPVNPKSVYAVSKLAGEEYVKAYHQRWGLNYSIVRFFNVYGPGQVNQFVMSKFVSAVNKGQAPVVYGDGSQIRSFCHVDDAVRGLVDVGLAQETENEVINIGNNHEPISMRDLAQRVIRNSGKALLPKFVSLEQSDRAVSREISRRIPDIAKAKEFVGYVPSISLDEGLSGLLQSKASHPNTWAPRVRGLSG